MPPSLRIRPTSLRPTLHQSQNHARICRTHGHSHGHAQPTHSRSQYTPSSSTPHTTHEVVKFSWVPRVFRKSTWDLIIPRSLRTRSLPNTSSPTRTRNPATYFIWIYLLIGSQAIRIIGVQSDFVIFTRRAELRLEKLREVLRALQAGEEIDVGTGVESEELEWEEAMREIEEEEDRWVRARRKMVESQEVKKREGEERAKEEERERLDASPIARAEGESKIVSAVGFY
jgi:hypothetical protein